MDGALLFAGLLGLLATAPALLHRYLRRLPVAPSCPACRAVTREVHSAAWAVQLFPPLAVTAVGECGRCGWRGRMRWRWAAGSVGGGRGG